jgi:hypothetical protein
MESEHHVDRVSDAQVLSKRPRLVEQRADADTSQRQPNKLGEHPRPQPRRREPECSTSVAGANSIEHFGSGDFRLETLKLVQRRLGRRDEPVVPRRIRHVDDLDDRIVRKRLGRDMFPGVRA